MFKNESLKTSVTIKCIRVFEWTCPGCNKFYQESKMHPTGLLLCTNSACRRAVKIDVVNHEECSFK